MNASEVADWWASFYGAATPVSHLLRQEIPDRWMRIHSLPESKRYAQTPDEYSEVLSRHNAVADKILGSQNQCFIFSGQYVEHPETENSLLKQAAFNGLVFERFNTVNIHDPQIDLDLNLINIWFAPIVWSSRQFDDIIKLVADDEVRHILIASLKTGEAYAPYDGGADLFLSSFTRRGETKKRFRRWLSTHRHGL